MNGKSFLSKRLYESSDDTSAGSWGVGKRARCNSFSSSIERDLEVSLRQMNNITMSTLQESAHNNCHEGAGGSSSSQMKQRQQRSIEEYLHNHRDNSYPSVENLAVSYLEATCSSCQSPAEAGLPLEELICTFCNCVGCSHCFALCIACNLPFCPNCSLSVYYTRQVDDRICIDCNCSR